MLAQDTTTTRNSVSEATHGRRILAIIPCCPCTLYTILLLNKTITHVMTHQAKQAKPLSCHAKSRKPYHTSEQHTPLLVTFVALGVERHLAPLLGSPVPPPMPLQHPQQCLICRRTQIEMDSQAQKIARNGLKC